MSFRMTRDDIDLITFATTRLLGRLDGLTDEEYRWEPVESCWTVRLGDDGTWHGDVNPSGTHDATTDPQPFTTISWRLWHLGASPRPTWPTGDLDADDFVRAWFNQIPAAASPAVGTADEARALVQATWKRMAETLARFTADQLAAPMGPAAGPFADNSLEGLVLHIADELIHHGAEVGVVRDLYAHRG
jgi:hypothetical protein